MSARKIKLDVYLEEVSKQCIFIKDDDYKKSQQVFNGVFEVVKTKMKEKCNYFGKYSNQVMHAGSVYDGLKVSKLDEFDMDIVIRLPINYDNGIVIENDLPGFVKLKIEEAFDYLDKQQDWEKCHKVTRDWRDTEKYFLQNKFRSWLHGIVSKALNDLDGKVTVNDITYLVKYKEAGPAYTLNIENDKGNEEFKLDVDLVPVIRFRHPRWPEGYRQVEGSNVKDWLVVPKPNKAIPDGAMKNRCWRLSFQEYEREMLKDSNQLKTTIRLVKKLRDSLQMKEIASYYIKTLFLWKIDKIKEQTKGDEKEKNKYWQKGLGTLFYIMVNELHKAIKEKNIRYFWHSENNLIENMKPTIQKLYVDKLKVVIDAIEANDNDKVVSSLLTVDEFQEFKKSDFYQKDLIRRESVNSMSSNARAASLDRQQSEISLGSNPDSTMGKDTSGIDLSLAELIKVLTDKVAAMSVDQKRFKIIEADANRSVAKLNKVEDILREIIDKVDKISEKVDDQNERLRLFSQEKRQLNDKIEMLLDKVDSQNERLKAIEMGAKYRERYEDDSALVDALEIDNNGIRLVPQNTPTT